jgi:homoserine dehydrogenase
VWQALRAHPEQFTVSAVLVRDRHRYEALGIPKERLIHRITDLQQFEPDVVVDTLPGLEPSRKLLAHFLRQGAHGVSANKAVIARHSQDWCAYHGQLRYSAAVGGAAPMIEAVSRHSGAIKSLSGVLNGTCNFILDQCADGTPFEQALAQARRLGFAEQDPTDDLAGVDAERKLRILARHAFQNPSLTLTVQALTERLACEAPAVRKQGLRLRQLARVWRSGDVIEGMIGIEAVPESGIFGQLRDEWSGLQILRTSGHCEFVRGRGAGRWPTTEAVMADLFEVWRLRSGQTEMSSQDDRLAAAR